MVDERSAGFMALGMAKASGGPAAVITTSGTAAANLYPAVVEASQGEVPLLVLTADRPHRLRDTDANQAMDQIRLFGTFPRAFMEVAPPSLEEASLRHLRGQACRAVALAQGPPGGPVHLNFPFDKPLEPETLDLSKPSRPGNISRHAWEGREAGNPFLRAPEPRWVPTEERIQELQEVLSSSSRGLIVVGPTPRAETLGPAALALSAATGFPILADPLSGARFSPSQGAQLPARYDLFLRSPRVRRGLVPDLILRMGASPTSSSLLTYLEEHADVLQIVVDQGHRWKDHLATGGLYVRAHPESLLAALTSGAVRTGDPAWKAEWERTEALTLSHLQREGDGPLLEGEILSDLAGDLPEGATLLVSSSMPVRELDAFGLPRPETLHVLANRGVSGIDGLVSTAVGLAAVRPGVVLGVLGDLAFLHDMNGLLAMKKAGIPVGFVVVNNDGGGIFEMLPIRRFDPAVTDLFTTPHGLDLERVAGLYEIPFTRVEDRSGFRSALRDFLERAGPFLLEVKVDRRAGHRGRRELLDRLVNALEEESLE